MVKKEYYRQIFLSYKELCVSGHRPCSFSQYCREHDVKAHNVRQTLKGEFENIRTLPGCPRVKSGLYATIYENFKNLCAEGKQPGTFREYCSGFGVSRAQIHSYLRRRGLRVSGLPGYSGPKWNPDMVGKDYDEVPFENVLFEEAGFLPPAQTNVITVRIDGHVAVSFPADTDVAVIAKFIKKMGKEAGHVES